MAIDQTMNEEDDRQMAQPPKKGGVLKIILLLLSMLLVAGASAGAALMFSGLLDGSGSRDSMEAMAESDHAPAKDAAPIYVELGEPFVVNFIQGNQIRYLQVKIEVMTRDKEIPKAIETHLPKIRNDLVFMFSSFDYAALGTVTGKQKIREEALAEIQTILKEEIGKPGIESVYFTSFVMQ